MGKEWCDCIVTYIDVIGTRKKQDPATLMRSLHALVAKMKSQLPSIAHAYTWNDSVLLLSFVDGRKSYSAAICDADTLKKQIDDKIAKSYAIAVKGRVFPALDTTAAAAQNSGVTVIRASSWAMANCFEIEHESKKQKWRKPWYVDIRIAGKIETRQRFEEMKVPGMLGAGGRKQHRTIRAFSGYLWN
jgi:hypothetical protein